MPVGLDETLDDILKDASDAVSPHPEDALQPLRMLQRSCNIAALIVKPAMLSGGGEAAVREVAEYVSRCRVSDAAKPALQVQPYPPPSSPPLPSSL